MSLKNKRPLKGLDKASKAERKPKSGGEGKKRKVFAESLGTSHLIELSNSIAESQSLKLKKRLDKAKSKAKWVKEKKAQASKATKTIDGVTAEDTKGKKMPLVSESLIILMIKS